MPQLCARRRGCRHGRGSRGRSQCLLSLPLRLLLLVAACRAPGDRRVDGSGVGASRAEVSVSDSKSVVSTAVVEPSGPVDVAEPIIPDAASGAPGEDLALEDTEPDPGSEMVTVRVTVEAAKPAEVVWGAKNLGPAPVEIQRPRGSGPLDLLVRAPGYLTVHTRAFTDRDDKLTIHLVPTVEAPRTFGYRAPATR
jgi:hypothetical protein